MRREYNERFGLLKWWKLSLFHIIVTIFVAICLLYNQNLAMFRQAATRKHMMDKN